MQLVNIRSIDRLLGPYANIFRGSYFTEQEELLLAIVLTW